MYTGFFGLREAPFSITPDPRYLFLGEHHREALAHLLYGVGEGGGFVLLTGEVGTGKTTLCRALLDQLPPTVDVALILNPKLTALELLATVCDELGLAYPAGATSVKTLVDRLYAHLLDAHARGRRTVIVIDEAQNLDADVLEQIRLLTNLETTREKLLQIILIGQPELTRLLDGAPLRQLAQRITARYHLLPFSEAETRAYIRHRIDVAGRSDLMCGEGPIFTDQAIAAVHRVSSGIPRLINIVCDRALLGAYARDLSRVDGATVRRAAAEALGRWPVRPAPPVAWAAAAAVTVAAVVAVWLAATTEPARRLTPGPVGRPVTAGVASAAALPGDPRARETLLPALLADPAVASDRDTAFATLFARWGVDAAGTPGAVACERAKREGLDCLPRRGTWMRLRRYNLPAILELTTPAGEPRYAVLTALADDRATLALGPRAVTLPLAAIEPFWDGSFVLFWRPPTVGVLQPGMRSRDVAWLRHRLGEPEPAATDRRRRDLYDDDLRERVIAFQRSHALVADGIVGEETLAQLSLVGAGVPVRLMAD
jgi:general secretion pathway protein A